MVNERIHRSTVDGTSIHFSFYPQEQAKGLVYILHGMAEHRGRYEELARFLNAEGYAVLVPDQRGHGDSPVDGLMGYYGAQKGMERQLVDWFEILNEVNQEGLLVYLLGHSMGSLWARALIKRHPELVAAVLLSGSPAKTPGSGFLESTLSFFSTFFATRPAKMLGKQMNQAFNRKLEGALTEFDWLSFDRENIVRYIADPKCGFPFTYEGYKTLLNLMREVYGGEAWDVRQPALPIKFLSGSFDPCGDIPANGVEQAANDLRAKGYQNVTVQYFPKSRHEIFNDLEKGDVFQETLRFFDAASGR